MARTCSNALVVAVLALAVLLGAGACDRGPPATPVGGDASAPADVGEVVEVVDGDTIEVRIGGRVETIRLLGIDTPETVDPNRPVGCHGPEAAALTHGLLPTGTAVRLERDEEARDPYDRLLAYVFRVDDGMFVNEAILAAGEAEVLSIEPNHAYASRLATAADAARRGGLGLWADCSPGGDR